MDCGRTKFLIGDGGIEVQGGLNIPAHSSHLRYSRACSRGDDVERFR